MARRKRGKTETGGGPLRPVRSEGGVETIRHVALGGFVALAVCTPLIPSESAAQFGALVVVIMLWLLLLFAWSAASVLSRSAWFRWHWVDAGAAVLLTWHSLSALVMAGSGQPRTVLNTMWQWLALGACYFLARQLVRQPIIWRAVCVVFIALAVGLAGNGFYQFFVSGPALRAEFDRDPVGILRRAGIESNPDSPEAKLFEDRIESTEPTATFALANSLAGFLAPWLILVLGIGWMAWGRREFSWPLLIGAATSTAAIGFCLLLTKSRTAVLATGFGLGLLVLERLRSRNWIDWRILAAGGVAVVLLFAATVAAGAFDLLVLSEAPKSMLYRLEYWQATLGLIGDHPVFGCGPGNFQAFYPGYKLPQASETIADPHNFVMEVWATAGTPALLVLLAMLAGWIWQMREPVKKRLADKDVSHAAKPEEAVIGSRWWVYVGGLLGVLIAFPCGLVTGFSPDISVLGIVLWAVPVVWLLDSWVVGGRVALWPAVAALLVLLVNLLAAGGIGFPGVAIVFWLLMALTLNAAEMQRAMMPTAFRLGVVAAFVALLAIAACYTTMYRPVLKARALLVEGWDLEAGERPFEAMAAFQRAIDADPYAADACLALARLQHSLVQQTQDPRLLVDFGQTVQLLLERQRHSHVAFRQIGDWHWELFRAGAGEVHAKEAIAAYEQAAELYPNHAFAHAQLAWCRHVAGDSAGAADAAAWAMELDSQNPHQEKKLAARQVFEPLSGVLGCENAEQLMMRLRRN